MAQFSVPKSSVVQVLVFLFFNLLSYLPSSYLSSRVGWVAHNEVPLLGPKGQWLMLM